MPNEWILNPASMRWGLTRKNKVGPVAELIRKCAPKTLREWEKFYLDKAYSKQHLKQLGETLFNKCFKFPACAKALAGRQVPSSKVQGSGGFTPHITRPVKKPLRSAQDELCVGFTMVEIVVILAILTAISGLVLANFTGLNEGTALNRSARELALGIRKAQNMSLAVTRIGGQIPVGVGVYLSSVEADSGKYFLFSDAGNQKYDSNPEEKIAGNEVRFEHNVKVGRIKDQNDSSYTVAHVIFIPPEATISFTDGTGTPIPGEKLEVQLSVSGQTKTLVIRTSGQVSIK